jgi:hypothetical protein
MTELGSRLPHDSRGFVHRRLLGAASGFLTGGVTGAASGFIGGGKPKPVNPAVVGNGFVPGPTSWKPGTPQRCIQNPANTACDSWRARPAQALRTTMAPATAPGFRTSFLGGDCPIPGQRRDQRTGKCRFFLGEQTGVDDTPVGQAVMGMYGAGLVPGNMIVDRAVCLPGMVIGNDGVCYDKKAIRNSQREWPRGARPLGSPEEMRALRIASRFAGRMDKSKERIKALKRAL